MTGRARQATGRRFGPGLTAALGFVAMSGSLSTDLYLPAFPDLARHFGVGASTVQLTLTAFLVGSAAGQLLLGAVSDALGRRRTLVVALAVFTACGYAATLSPGIETLIGIRAAQGLSGTAGAVLARAVIADLLPRGAAVRAFSTLFVFIALGPAVASPLGGWLTQLGGWRAALCGLAVLSTAMLVTAALIVPESLPRERRHPFTLAALTRNVAGLLRDPGYLGHVVAFGAGYAALMTYIGSSSFIMQDVFEVGPVGYALTFSFTSIAVMTGAWLNGRVAEALCVARALRFAQALVIVAAAAAAALALTGVLTVGWYLPLVSVFAIGCGAVMSSASALAVGRAVHAAGAGSALLGFCQFAFGAIASPLGGILGTGTAAPATVFMAAFALVGLAAGLAGTALAGKADR